VQGLIDPPSPFDPTQHGERYLGALGKRDDAAGTFCMIAAIPSDVRFPTACSGSSFRWE
jgi:hypothetical protein